MSWADEYVSKPYEAVESARSKNPAFVELASLVLQNLNDGIAVFSSWNRSLSPGLLFQADRSWSRGGERKFFEVRPDYSQFGFLVTMSFPREPSRFIEPSISRFHDASSVRSPISEEIVDRIARELVGDYIPHLKSSNYHLPPY